MLVNSEHNSHDNLIRYTRLQLLQLKGTVPLKDNKLYLDIKTTVSSILKYTVTRRRKWSKIPSLISSYRYNDHHTDNQPGNINLANSIVISPKESVQSLRRAKNYPRHIQLDNLVTIKYSSCYHFPSNTQLSVWNARSVCNKLPSICSSIFSQKTDIFIITETWLSENAKQQTVLGEFKSLLSEYDFISNPRRNRKGGGVGVIVRQGLKVKINRGVCYESFEHLDVNISMKSNVIHLINIYRPPQSKNNGQSTQQFILDFASFLESAIISSGILLITGDFNLHFQYDTISDVKQFKYILDSFGLVQHIHVPTHEKGHTLDLVITSASENYFSCFSVDFSLPSDHGVINFFSELSKPCPQNIARVSRNFRPVTPAQLASSIENHTLSQPEDAPVDQLVDEYNTKLSLVLDELAPTKEKVITAKSRALRFNDTDFKARAQRRSAERKWEQDNLQIHKQIFLVW
ncbi:hypothetical protein SNE40_018216 [Patella caerulea]|uniref:Endonuclease/exonuclease/phosphatase domain-containing protein n=1 Tax=Patella caerulea TaxID=87958 RepID=A0AAN8J994_PATCE